MPWGLDYSGRGVEERGDKKKRGSSKATQKQSKAEKKERGGCGR